MSDSLGKHRPHAGWCRVIVALAVLLIAAGLPDAAAAAYPAVGHPTIAHPAVAHPAVAHPAVAHPAVAHPAVAHPAADRIKVDRPNAGDLDTKIAAAAQQLEVVVEQYDQSRDDLAALQTRAAALGAQLTPLSQDLAARRRILGAMAAQTYERTRTGPTVALFAAPEPHQFVQRLLVLDQLAAQQRRTVDEYRRTETRIGDTRQAIHTLAVEQQQEQLRLAIRKAGIQAEIATLRTMRQAAYGTGSRFADDITMPAPPYVPGQAGRAVAFVFAQLGKPYSWGADGPGAYDCSGLTLAAWRAAGVHLPHNAAAQYGGIRHLNRADLRPGDLVFFYGHISHVGMYVGRGLMIHAPEYGEPVRVAPIDSLPIHGYGRPT